MKLWNGRNQAKRRQSPSKVCVVDGCQSIEERLPGRSREREDKKKSPLLIYSSKCNSTYFSRKTTIERSSIISQLQHLHIELTLWVWLSLLVKETRPQLQPLVVCCLINHCIIKGAKPAIGICSKYSRKRNDCDCIIRSLTKVIVILFVKRSIRKLVIAMIVCCLIMFETTANQ